MIYLDYNGSTPVDPQVADLVADVATKFANPSSIQHRAGQEAAETIEEARHRIAVFVSAAQRDIVLTSGASEASAIAIIGAALGAPQRPNVVVSPTEHKAVLAAADTAARLSGGELRVGRVGSDGVVDVDHLRSIVDDSVCVVAAMAANNETGVINPISEIGELVRAAGAVYFCDATQLAGKGDLTPVTEEADLMVLSSHKIYGPKGAGALVADRHVQKRLVPIFAGGGQERGLRGGTPNTPAIAGFGLAAETAAKEWRFDEARLSTVMGTLWQALTEDVEGVNLNGADTPRLGNTLNVRFDGVDSEALMASMPNVAVSSGSACQAAVTTQSHVLTSMGLTERQAGESIRISAGRPTTSKEVEQARREIVSAVRRVRQFDA
uniref:cysteine desulfurase family protein n=1 Tax=Gordonia sp. B7-2 TaxID=3420932 RepID=UPI003D8CE12F